jgi:uncharacterized phage protein (predicted DNA packaging)
MTLCEAKVYLRVDHDSEDQFIQNLITAAESYIVRTTGKTQVKTPSGEVKPIKSDELFNLAVKILLAHWYDNRGIELPGNYKKISHSIDALLDHISMCGDYL